jgi:membrane protein DedA with SNARE-associated domain
MHALIGFWFTLVEKLGYLGVVLLMAMESSIFPVPSEAVMPPAVYWAEHGSLRLGSYIASSDTAFWLVVLAGTLGSWIGSAATYWISLRLGRPFLERFGKWVHLTPQKIDRAERFVHRYEAGGIFFARLLPVVRHVVSIPAGLAAMPFGIFSAMTLAGSFTWCLVLAKFSQHIFRKHSGEDLIGTPAALVEVMKHESLPIVGFIVALLALYLLAVRLTAPSLPRQEPDPKP